MKIVFLHGIGDGDTEMRWLRGLNQGLAEQGSPQVCPDDVIAPRYAGLLRTEGIKARHPERTYSERKDHEARRAFERRQGQVQRMLQKSGALRVSGLGVVPDAVLHPAQEGFIDVAPLLKQVKNYMTCEGLRAAVLQNILDDLPESGDIMLIGHSLGSVIAIDLLDHLPPGLRVRRFITLGSPAGSESLHRGSERILKRFPYGRVDDWSNFVDSFDPVTSGRGLAGIFPGAQDFGIGGAWRHVAERYLRQPAVAKLVGDALFPSSDIVPSSNGMVLRLSDTEASTLLTMAYARRVGAILDGDKRTRYEDALEVLKNNFTQSLIEQSEGRPLPPELAQLAHGQIPALPRRWDLPETVRQVAVLAFTNVLDPYEIDAEDARFHAVPELFVDLGWSSGTGKRVKDAIREVSERTAAEKRGLGMRTKVLAAAAGIALIAAAPIGIAMSGAAGAAALGGGLAAFGPVGVVGGLATLSALATTGTMVTSIAATTRGGEQPLLLDPTGIAIQVATAHALHQIDEEYDHELWYRLAWAETKLAGELNRLTPFSDNDSPASQRLGATLRTIRSLMDFMREKDLTPPALTNLAS